MNEDIRQSNSWAAYLNTLGWESYRTSRGINVEVRDNVLGGYAKVQRPFPLNKEDLKEIDDICKEHKVILLKLEPNIDQDVSIIENSNFLKSNFPLAPSKTVKINLMKTEGDLWDSLSESGKYGVNRANREQNTVSFHIYPSKEVVEDFYKIYLSTAKKSGLPGYSVEDFVNKVSIFEQNCFIGFSYDEKKRHCGTAMYLVNDNNVWYMHGGTTRKGRKNKAGYLLFWESILYFKNVGNLSLDFEGVYDERFHKHTKSWKGFTEFKKKFGGDEVSFPEPYFKIYNRAINKFFKTFKLKL